MALALGHLHSKNVIYRDLKLENVLLCEDGYIKVADFGLSKNIEMGEQAYTLCGTPEYLAPEIIQGVGHTHVVDWWTLGIVVYEMIIGFTPFFNGGDKKKMYDSIQSKQVSYPDLNRHGISISNDCRDFINKCLTKDPSKRLGSKGDVDAILAHKWFRSLNINKLMKK